MNLEREFREKEEKTLGRLSVCVKEARNMMSGVCKNFVV